MDAKKRDKLKDLRAATPDSLINEFEAAELLGYSVFWMRRKRWKGGGPPFFKIPGGGVRYQRQSLELYILEHMRANTSSENITTPQAA